MIRASAPGSSIRFSAPGSSISGLPPQVAPSAELPQGTLMQPRGVVVRIRWE